MILRDAILILSGIAIGWAAGRRAPEGVEYLAYLRGRRFLRRVSR